MMDGVLVACGLHDDLLIIADFIFCIMLVHHIVLIRVLV